MPRRTKEDAAATRSHLLDTAEAVFERRGVAGTSLAEIAAAAGVTRGAIYWHFEDKADLFNAMMERATLPLEHTEAGGRFIGKDAGLAEVRDAMLRVLHQVATQPQLRRVFDIAIHKVEYVGEMNAVRIRQLDRRNQCQAEVESAFRRAVRRGEMPGITPAGSAALGLLAIFDGLLHNWMLDRTAFDLQREGERAIDAYFRGLGAAG
jgi:TetR/AcrR family transcriptional regulator, acrAB operon repressor